MDSEGETKPSSGYGKPPWIFKGSALYQLHLVKAKTAKACLPKELRLVEAFGYTLGGFFLASYDDSPAGVFDELVVIAGLVWNPPTSCAWATKVLVSSNEACEHGRKEVGLPSHVASFAKSMTGIPRRQNSTNIGFLNMIGMGTSLSDSKHHVDNITQVTQVTDYSAPDTSFRLISSSAREIVNRYSLQSLKSSFKKQTETTKRVHSLTWWNYTYTEPNRNLTTWMGPIITVSLPSFSGCTEHNPDLLKYSCKIKCRVRPVGASDVEQQSSQFGDDDERSLNASIMLSKPIFALKFSSMTMQVEAPSVVPRSNSSLPTS